MAMINRHGNQSVYHQILLSSELGGGAMVALHLARDLTARGWDTPVWIPARGATWSEAERLGLTAQRYDLQSASSASSLQAAKANWLVWGGLSRGVPGLVHVHAPYAYGVLRHGLAFSGLKRVAHVQIEEEPDLLRWAFKSPPDLIITCARYLVELVRQALPEHHRERQRIAAVPNAVDITKFVPGNKAEAKQRVGAPSGVPLIVQLANLAPHKGQETAIRAAGALKARGIDACFWLAGTERGGVGAYSAHLHAIVRDLGVGDRVRLLGQRDDVPDLLRATDFFLLPSTCEGLPLSILEAMATRVPVLAAPIAGIREVVADGTTGFLIPAGDADGYARRLEQLLANPDLANRVAAAAYEHATREYSWSTYSGRIVELYQDVLESRTTRLRARSLFGWHRRPARRPEPCSIGESAR
jgi:glycosyltransferase involved in cell wall biosynthesis